MIPWQINDSLRSATFSVSVTSCSTTDPEVVAEAYLEFFARALRHAIERKGWPASSTTLEELQNQARVGLEWFSDSIVLFALDDTDAACTSVVETAAWLAFQTVVAPVRMRFGVDYGEIIFNRHKGIMIGKPIVVADRLQKAQNWSGGAFTRDALSRLQHTGAMDYVVDYEVPIKSRPFATRAALDWTFAPHLGIHFLWSKASAEPPKEFELQHPDFVEKWRNTRAFHEAVCRSCSARARRGA